MSNQSNQQTDDGAYFIIKFGDSSVRLWARSPREAHDVVRNQHEAEWGDGAFDQYDVQVEEEFSYGDAVDNTSAAWGSSRYATVQPSMHPKTKFFMTQTTASI